jgi:thioesterase domain-containing protein
MRQYRIKQTDDNKYYAQTRQLLDAFFGWDTNWYSITNDLKEVTDSDYSEDWGDPLTTVEQAQERIEQFKLKPKYPKYYPSK